MDEFILVPYGPGFLRFTVEEFNAAQRRGVLMAAPDNRDGTVPGPRSLVDSRAMGAILNVAETWIEMAAKTGQIPSVRVGRYLRFDPESVLAALRGVGHAD
jgi:hypothetical protein